MGRSSGAGRCPPSAPRSSPPASPQLTLRTEPAHREAVIELGLATQIEPAQWQLISESMRGWVEEHAARPADLGMRLIYRWDGSTPKELGPDCDFAMPLA